MKGIILTGEIGEGKTTALLNFTKQNPAVGILTLKIKGKRYFINIKTGEKHLVESNGKNKKTNLKVGNFTFNKEAFSWARKSILTEAHECNEPIIIDEYGHLELKDKGFEPLLKQLVKIIRNEKRVLIIVVRKSLVNDFVKKFDFLEWNVVNFKDGIKI
jgi:nucleoside-triphosphatase THEP1